ncbi:vacuolar membrane protein [Rhodotorula toruloides]|uniref:Vacuolar membrane protein n=1 Tax=Rhodotorula toruloides TaxID=5286 RepID=A0A511KH32_RHOTO|nr:vacuolar membrane protein [Rhodotorula toruloides]
MVGEWVEREVLSTGLGIASICVWLFAQSPQVIQNWRSGSVEGLALPFLVSWFAGDFTNLLGCILTHQLPFQTYLAAYFILVDVVLCGQFVYYSRLHPAPYLPPLSEQYPHVHAPSPHASLIRQGHRSTSRKGRTRSSKTRLPRTSSHDEEDDPMMLSWTTDSSARTPTSPQMSTQPFPSRSSTSHSIPSIRSTVPPSPTAPERGRTLQRSASRTFDPTLTTIAGSPASYGASMPQQSMHASHVSFNRNPEALGSAREVEEEVMEVPRHTRQRTSGSRSRPPAPSRRSTSVVFLSIGALVALGQMGGGPAIGPMEVGHARGWSSASPTAERSSAPASANRGRRHMLRGLHHPALLSSPSPSYHVQTAAPANSHVRHSTFPLDVSSPAVPAEPRPSVSQRVPDAGDDDTPPPRSRNWERFVGRASAWLCTTAYLTSRLPQIWQNFRRRSVEGLAMALFLFAFVGNSLYVASILTNPLFSTPGFLLESMPYLLGSGGTLCFDLVILAQSRLYSEKRKARRERERRRRSARTLEAEEEAALLQADEDGETDTETGSRPRRPAHKSRSLSGKRSRSTSTLGYGRSRLDGDDCR